MENRIGFKGKGYARVLILDGNRETWISPIAETIGRYFQEHQGTEISVEMLQPLLPRTSPGIIKSQGVMVFWAALTNVGVTGWLQSIRQGEAYIYQEKPLGGLGDKSGDDEIEFSIATSSVSTSPRRPRFDLPQIEFDIIRRGFAGDVRESRWK